MCWSWCARWRACPPSPLGGCPPVPCLRPGSGDRAWTRPAASSTRRPRRPIGVGCATWRRTWRRPGPGATRNGPPVPGGDGRPHRGAAAGGWPRRSQPGAALAGRAGAGQRHQGHQESGQDDRRAVPGPRRSPGRLRSNRPVPLLRSTGGRPRPPGPSEVTCRVNGPVTTVPRQVTPSARGSGAAVRRPTRRSAHDPDPASRATNGRGVLACGDADRGVLVRGQLSVLDREDPDLGECFAIIAYGLDQGRIRGVDVSGLNLVLIAHIPGNVLAGNWEIVALVDERATPEQRPAAGRVHRQARRAPGRRGAADRNGEGRGVRPDQPPRRGRDRDPADPWDGGDRDGPVPGSGRGASPPYRTRSSPRCRAPPPGWPRPACTGSTCPSTA